MTKPDEKNMSNIVVDLIAFIVVIIAVILTWSTPNQNWLGVGAGVLAILSLCSLFIDYFDPPKTGETIQAPNRFARISAGTLGIVSGIFWVLSAWPGLI